MRRTITVLLLACGVSVSAFAKIDGGLLALVPSGAKIITSVDISQAKTSPFGIYVMNRINSENQNFEQFVRETGFDPRRDVLDFVFASTGTAGDNQSHDFALLVRGIFDEDRIKSVARAKGVSVQNYQGVDLFVEPSHRRANAFAFPQAGIAVMGDLASVQQIVAGRANPTVLDPVIQQRVSEVGANDAWFVSAVPGSYFANHIAKEANAPEQAQALQSILESSGGIHFGDVVQLTLDAIARSEKDASSLADIIRFLGSMVQMQRQHDPRAGILAPAFDAMVLKTAGDTVHFSISLPEKNVEQLAELGPKVTAGQER